MSSEALLSVTVACKSLDFFLQILLHNSTTLYELLDPETKVQRVRSYGLYIFHYISGTSFLSMFSLRISGIISFIYRS